MTWKKSTLKSLAVWCVGASLLVGWQIGSQHWTAMATRGANQLGTLLLLGVIAMSVGFMRQVEPKELLISRRNTPTRNALNGANFAASIMGAAALAYLSGLFVEVPFPSLIFDAAAGTLLVSVLFQVCFVVVTRERNGAD